MAGRRSFERFLNPCFLFRPDIFFRACWRKLKPRPERCLVQTAWGDWLEVEPHRFIGANIYMRGVHELAVCEVLWRLAGAGETAVDAGANIGVMTSLLSRRVGERGRVLAFEAHPEVFRQLERNARHWERRSVEVFNRALSSKPGTVPLREGEHFDENEGTSRVAAEWAPGPCHSVQTVRLDDVLQQSRCGVSKIDIEGHELEMLTGAADALRGRRVRDLVLECSSQFPAPAHQLLLDLNYQLFEIRASLRGPQISASAKGCGRADRLADYLATLSPLRAEELLRPRGWQVLNPADSQAGR